MFDNNDIIDAYTRADAIADGELVDVTETAKEAGIRYPLALTRAAWIDCVEWTDETSKRKPEALQDEAGRLWDVIWMTRAAMTRPHSGPTAAVHLLRVPADGDDLEPRPATLHVHVGPGDSSEPVLTVSLPGEDL